MSSLVLTTAQKQAILSIMPQMMPFTLGMRMTSPGGFATCFASRLSSGPCAMAGGTWFDWDHGRLAHRVPDALRAAGLPEFAPSAEKALAVHFPPPYPDTIFEWAGAIEKIRDAQLEDDFDKSVYDAVEDEFFALYHADPKHFRNRLGAYVLEHLED